MERIIEWVFDHLQLVLAVAAAFAWWLNQRRRERAGLPADYDEDGVPDTMRRTVGTPPPVHTDEQERTRRIQEEIRRKIAQRRAGTPAAPEPPVLRSPAPAVPEPAREPAPRPELMEEWAPPPVVVVAQDYDYEAERQRALEEQMRDLDRQRREAAAAAAAASRAIPAAPPAPTGVWATPAATVRLPAHALVAELRDPQALRRAIVTREVLGPPVAMR